MVRDETVGIGSGLPLNAINGIPPVLHEVRNLAFPIPELGNVPFKLLDNLCGFHGAEYPPLLH